MKDGYGREIDYLRISLTDKCNLRCAYCMPPDGIKHLGHADILSFEELLRLVCIMSRLGIKRVRLTGGEPLVRKGAVDLVRMLKSDCGILKIAMTSNGILLKDFAGRLREAGLSHINISLDTLDRVTFRNLTGTDALEAVKQGIETAVSSGLCVKLNCVPIRGINDGEILDLVRYAGDVGADIRFIELMPVGCGAGYEGVPTEELKKLMESVYGRASETGNYDAFDIKGPAVYYTFEGYGGRIGFISPISHKFCESCNRLRLTAEGYLKLCLQYPEGADLKTPIRNGAFDEEIEEPEIPVAGRSLT